MEHRFSSRYVDVPNTPLYPFGYGLSYTKFEYSDITASAEVMTAQKPLTLSVTVTNTGDVDGDEIVQLYIQDVAATRVSRPLRELKDFKRISLAKGESQAVEFVITEEMLRFLNYDGEFASEAGKFIAYIGESSSTDRRVAFTLE
jgi:beta-glucosidase